MSSTKHHDRGIGNYLHDAVVPGEWIHVAVTVTNQITTIYKNGIYRDCDFYYGAGNGQTDRNAYTSDQWITPEHASAPVRMGTRYADAQHSYFKTAIRDVVFWNRPSTGDEVAALYRSDI